MIAVNLLNWRQAECRRQLRRWLWLSIVPLLLIQLALLLCWLSLTESAQRWQRQLALWQQATAQARQLAQRYAAAQTQQQALLDEAARRQQRRQRLAQWPAFMQQLENSMPDELWLSSLTQQQQRLQLEGVSLRPEMTRQLQQRLRASVMFPRWQAGALKKGADGLYHFTLTTGETGGAADEK